MLGCVGSLSGWEWEAVWLRGVGSMCDKDDAREISARDERSSLPRMLAAGTGVKRVDEKLGRPQVQHTQEVSGLMVK